MNKSCVFHYQTTFGKTPIPQRSGGSIPIVSLFEDELKSKTILMGFGLDSDAIHSPNEHFGVFNYLKGIETIPHFYKYFTELFDSLKKRSDDRKKYCSVEIRCEEDRNERLQFFCVLVIVKF